MNKVLRVATEDFPESFDPAASTVAMSIDAIAHTIFNRLVKFKRGTTEIEPSIAASWTISDDNLTYTFTLREGIEFHSNSHFRPSRPLEASDVVFSFNRLIGVDLGLKIPGIDSPYARGMGLSQLIARIEARDRSTVEVTLTRPHSPFIRDIATAFASIQSLEYAQHLSASDKGDYFISFPVGTGPFSFERSSDVAELKYRAHEGYFEGRPKVDFLEFKIGRDPGHRIDMLAEGEVDIALYPNPRDISSIATRSDIGILTIPSLVMSYLAFNFRRAPLQHHALREALCCSIDRKTYLDIEHSGNRAVVAPGVIPTGIAGAIDVSDQYAFDPERARWLVKHHGFDGITLEILSRASRSTVYPEPKLATEFFIDSWARIGIHAVPNYLEVTEFYKQRNRDLYDIAVCGWTSDNGDPDNFLSLLSSESIEAGMNYAAYANPHFDELIQQGRETSDEVERHAVYAEIQKLVAAEKPWLPLTYNSMFIAMSKRVHNYQMSPFGDNNFMTVSVE